MKSLLGKNFVTLTIILLSFVAGCAVGILFNYNHDEHHTQYTSKTSVPKPLKTFNYGVEDINMKVRAQSVLELGIEVDILVQKVNAFLDEHSKFRLEELYNLIVGKNHNGRVVTLSDVADIEIVFFATNSANAIESEASSND